MWVGGFCVGLLVCGCVCGWDEGEQDRWVGGLDVVMWLGLGIEREDGCGCVFGVSPIHI